MPFLASPNTSELRNRNRAVGVRSQGCHVLVADGLGRRPRLGDVAVGRFGRAEPAPGRNHATTDRPRGQVVRQFRAPRQRSKNLSGLAQSPFFRTKGHELDTKLTCISRLKQQTCSDRGNFG